MRFTPEDIEAIAKRNRSESDAVDPEQLKNHPLAAAAVSRTVEIPDYNTPSSEAYKQRAEQIAANDPDIVHHQALLGQDSSIKAA